MASSQSLTTINSDQLYGPYKSFESDSSNNFYALSECYVFKFDLNDSVEVVTGPKNIFCSYTDFAIDTSGRIYISSKEDGLLRQTDEDNFVSIIPGAFEKICFNNKNDLVLIAGTLSPNNFYYFNDLVSLSYNEDNSIFPGHTIFDLTSDSKGDFWIAGFDGLFRLSGGQLELILNESVKDVFINDNDVVFMTLGNGDAATLDIATLGFKILPSTGAIRQHIVADRNNKIYVTTDSGVEIFNGEKWVEYKYLSLKDNADSAFQVDVLDGKPVLSFYNDDDIYLWEEKVIAHSEPEIKNNFTIYPNPSQSQFSIKSEKPFYEIQIFNASGELIVKKKNQSNYIQIDTPGFLSGVYTLRLLFNNAWSSSKIIIQN